MAREQLHDEIDLLEGYLERAQEGVRRVVLEHLHEALEQNPKSIGDAMRYLAAKVEELELQGLTTEVVQALGGARRKL